MYTTIVFIEKNTPELRMRLEKLGYSKSTTHSIDGECLFTATTDITGNVYGSIPLYRKEAYTSKEHVVGGRINCETNEELFLALAALRDDSDIGQYFICIENYTAGCGKQYKNGDILLSNFENFSNKQQWRKATSQELIEYFKN